MKFKEADEVIRWYPTDVKEMNGGDLFKKEYADIYIHIPFCRGKCGFCPFNSMPLNKQNLDEYFSHLKAEVLMYASQPSFKYKKIHSIWIGGGTPTAVPFSSIKEILDLVSDHFEVMDDCEITLEGNLFDFKNEEYLKEVSESVVNRLSIGVQSFNDKYLKMMGRTYTYNDIEFLFSFIRKYDFNISIDLMYRYPGQTLKEMKHEIDMLEKNKEFVDHVTMYSLILFPKLSTYKKIVKGELPKQPGFSVYEQMNLMLSSEMPKIGYNRYTAYHFAKEGKENVYNLDRWGFPQKECISFGPGAFGQLNGYIYCNEHAISDYYQKIDNNIYPVQKGKKINLLEALTRYMVLGTKTLEIDLNLFEEYTGVDPMVYYKDLFEDMLNEDLITISEEKLKLTNKGIVYIADINRIFQTQNNLLHTQPQYEILDMFDGKRDTFHSEVIED